MLIKTRGIVLRAIKYSETSLITDVYTEGKGLQKYIVGGVRSKNARVKASLLQVMSLLELVAYHREGRDLHRVREIRPAYLYHSIPFDVRRSAVGMFMAELARKTIREPEENQQLFDFLFRSFHFLDNTDRSVANLHLYFLVQLAAFLGFSPGGTCTPETPCFDLREGVFVSAYSSNELVLDPEKSALLYTLLCTDREAVHTVNIGVVQRRNLLHDLLNFYRLHLENFPQINSHLILQEVLD